MKPVIDNPVVRSGLVYRNPKPHVLSRQAYFPSVVIMDNGEILKEGTLQQLLEEDTDEKVVEFTAEHEFVHEQMNSDDPLFVIHQGDTSEKGFVTLSDFETELPAFMAYMKSRNITLKHMECRRKTLDDLFVSLTGRKINE